MSAEKYSDALGTLLQELRDLDLSGKVEQEQHQAGAGGYCDVFRGTVQGVVVGIKHIRHWLYGEKAHNKLAKALFREIKIWSGLKHRNILPFLGYSMDGKSNVPTLISPWMECSNVIDYLDTHPDADVVNIVAGVTDALAYLHAQDIVHADLKSGNIVVSPLGEPLLMDFGISRFIATSGIISTTQELKGTFNWMAKELLEDNPKHTTQSDIWALGMTIYEFLVKEPPYASLSPWQVMQAILQSNLPPKPANIEEDNTDPKFLWKMCNDCWARVPLHRPSAEQILNKISEYKSPINNPGYWSARDNEYHAICDDLRSQKVSTSSEDTAYILELQQDEELKFPKASTTPYDTAASEAEPQVHEQSRHTGRFQKLLKDTAEVRMMIEQPNSPQSRNELVKHLTAPKVIKRINQFAQITNDILEGVQFFKALSTNVLQPLGETNMNSKLHELGEVSELSESYQTYKTEAQKIREIRKTSDETLQSVASAMLTIFNAR